MLLAAAFGMAVPTVAAAALRTEGDRGHHAKRVTPPQGLYYGRSADHLVEMKATVRLRRRYQIEGPFLCHRGGDDPDHPPSGYFGAPFAGRDNAVYIKLGASKSTFAYTGRSSVRGWFRSGADAGVFTVKGAFRNARKEAEVSLRAAGCYDNRPFELTLKRCLTRRSCRFRGPPPPPAPPITITEIIPTPFCQEEKTYVLLDSGVEGGAQPLSFFWESGVPGVTSTEGSPVFEYPGGGSYTVRLTVTDSQGNSASRSQVAEAIAPC